MTVPNVAPIFPCTPNVGQGLVTTACTDRTGGTTTDLVSILTAGPEGSLLRSIHFHSTGTSIAACVLIFLLIGSTYTLIGEVTVTAITSNTTTQAWEGVWTPDLPPGQVLPAGAQIVVGVTVTQNIVAIATAGDY
jgi:hypothetical protein